MILQNRVLWSDNGTLKNLSLIMNNHISGSQVLPIVGSQDYIYLGSDAPFNHRWVEVKVANTDSLSIAVEYWDGKNWVQCVEVIDETVNSAGTASLNKSGFITWVPNRKKTGWSADDTNDGNGNVITGLDSVTIYDLFWVRLKFTGSASGTTELSFLGHKFSNDEDLFNLYPEFETTEAKERFKDSLTKWDQLHFEAAKQIIRDLKSNRVINSGNQVLEVDVFKLPSIHKVAELIFSAYGTDWEKDKQQALVEYKRAMAVDLFNVDLDQDGRLSSVESKARAGMLYR